MNAGSITVAIPAFQAARTVGDVVRRAGKVGADVLVIDDGSTDQTADAARAAGARVICHAQNLGKGCALQTAFHDAFARGRDAVVTVDADGQHLPELIPRLLDAADGADLVIGDRTHLYSSMSRGRRMANRYSTRVISFVAGRRLVDVQCGFRVYTRELIEATGFPEPRFEAESAVLVRAVRRGLRVRWVPIELGFADGRATSHFRPLIDSLRIAAAVLRARFVRPPDFAQSDARQRERT